MSGAIPSGRAVAADAAEPVVSALRASIPSAADDPRLIDHTQFQPSSCDGKPRWLSKSHKRLLASFVEPLWERVEALPDDKRLWQLIEACRAVSPTNCGWPDYAMAKLLHGVAVQSLSNRLAAQAIEARRAATGTGAVHESAVAESDAPDPGQDTPTTQGERT